MNEAAIPCQYCGGEPVLVFTSSGHRAAECRRCGARGPCVEPKRPDCDAQAVAGWNAGRKFGRISAAAVPRGMPSAVCSIAERLRLTVESLYTGELGEPDAAILLLRDHGRVHTITHRISDADTVRVLEAVRDTARIRAGVAVPTYKPAR